MLGSPSVVWTCLKCDGPNYSSVLFDLHSVQTQNRFNHLGDDTNESDLSFDSLNSFDLPKGQPKATSSPVKPRLNPCLGPRLLRILNVNCQSLVNKKGPFYNLIDSIKPDIIIATETWFNSSILDAEYFSNHFTVHRKDRGNATGGES